MPTTDPADAALDAFARAFGGRPTHLGRAPGRVELLGNHTDYNGGLVMAAAIDRATVVVGRAVEGRSATVHTCDLGEADRFDLDAIETAGPGAWANYVRGVVRTLQHDLGPALSGFQVAIAGDVPIGAGLSSSASLQAAVAAFLLGAGLIGPGALPDDDAGRLALAHCLRRSENEFVGVASGLLDQFSVLFGREGHALTLDCRSLAFGRVPLGEPAPAIVVCDSRTSRRLADGMYNRRRAECEGVVERVRIDRGDAEVRSLRDVTLDDLTRLGPTLDPAGLRRARHVLTENARVEEGAEALRLGDLDRFGRLVSASHASSRDDFENSSPALDALVASAEEAPGFLGGKLSGAGWAGCTVNLVESARADAFAESVRAGYARRRGQEPVIHVCRAAPGASSESL
jgi:galactokinase